MVARSDITVNFELSPRIVTVAAPSVTVNLQDIHDTLVDIEDSIDGQQHPRLILSAGKETLGGGVTVGITSTLQNCQIAFEARSTPDSSGAATSTGTTTLEDTLATFIADGVARGALIVNHTDSSVSTVLSVESETLLTHAPLLAGIAGNWSIADDYDITNEIQCTIDGGNLVAVDSIGADLDPVFPTVGTQIVRTASSSGTISNIDSISDNIQRFIESLRKSHHAYGQVFYWDPVLGNDTNTGLTISQACKTFAVVESKTTAFMGDVIFALDNNDTGPTVVTTPIVMAKERVYLRGPGRSFCVVANDAANPAVAINAQGCGIEGIAIQQNNINQPAVKISTYNILLKNAVISGSASDGIEITNITAAPTIRPVTILENVESINNGGHALHIHDNVGLTFVRDSCHFEESGGDGIRISTNVDDVHIIDAILHENAGYGINITNSTVSNTSIIRPHYINNVTGNLSDSGTNTRILFDDTKLQEAWQRLGLDPNAPITNNADGSITVGNITLNATPSGSSIIQTRA